MTMTRTIGIIASACRKRVCLSALTLYVCASILAPVTTAADASVTAHITGTGIGIMFRSNPNDWNSKAGPGGKDGDTAVLHCELMGAPVGQRANRAWYWATTHFGTGWLPDHFLDTPIKANQWLPGLPVCPSGGQTQAPAVAPPLPGSAVRSIFFSGTSRAPGVDTLMQVADDDLPYGAWSNGDCSTGKVASAVRHNPSTSVLAGWSKGRLGPIYYLAALGPDQAAQTIHTIILFDPGGHTSFIGSCDQSFNINYLLAEWLRANTNNRLIVFAGADSEEGMWTPHAIETAQSLPQAQTYTPTFTGLWRFYFAGIWRQHSGNQALVCDYLRMGHQDVLSSFAQTVQRVPTTCPVSPTGQHPIQWHP
jgi:hypothetical protein